MSKRWEVKPDVGGEYRHLLWYVNFDRTLQCAQRLTEISREILAQQLREARRQCEIVRKLKAKEISE